MGALQCFKYTYRSYGGQGGAFRASHAYPLCRALSMRKG